MPKISFTEASSSKRSESAKLTPPPVKQNKTCPAYASQPQANKNELANHAVASVNN
jgi:hypothetical protein